MMDPELIVRPASPAGATGSNSPKTWSTSSIPKLDSLDESAPLDTAATKFLAKANANQRRESVGPGLPQIRRETNLILEEVKQRGRRKSWHSKLERKRRKGVIAPTSPPGMTPASNGGGENHQRQKRPSWWNIFVPDHWPRSRRASQDVGHVALNSEVLGPWKRSKSRSVDHGFSAPFDLEALRSKVEGRFESVDKLSRDNDSIEKKKCEPPVNTITYTVGDRDTLTSVAARFDTTPSELTKLNRLATPFIFAGQVLRVPDRGNKGDANQESQASTPTESQHDNHDDLPPEEKELLDNLRPVSPKPGHIERVRTPLGSTSTTVDTEDEVAFKERFLKINVRHITDGQGVVSGVLLVTPNAVMFDPNVSDPLVIEHGPESYGVIAPMEFVVNAAIYYDIAHMRVGNRESSKTDIKPEIYHAASAHPACGKCSPSGTTDDTSLLVKDETLSELGANVDDADSVCSCTGERTERGGDAFPKAFERDLVTPTNLQQGDSTESESGTTGVTNTQSSRSLEERRKSMLDHHWPIASKDRSLEETTAEDTPAQTPTASVLAINTVTEEDSSLVKLSCHDSGIDIRDPLPPIQPVPKKKTYSDAEIVLSSDWVPPITIAPTHVAGSTETGSSDSRKKTSSVSFSIDSNEQDSSTQAVGSDKEDTEKQETKKNKMLKRLSYPLAWMETFAGSDEEKTPSSVPHSADGHHSSVFSKFISSSPINLVEFGTGLFLSKTPSEDSGGSGGPNSAGLIAAADACAFSDTAAPSTAATSQQALAANAASAYAGRSSVGTFIRNPSEGNSTGRSNKPQPPKLDYRSMVSVEDMPELFVSFDKLIPRPARSCEDPPLYLRLRMGKPLDRPIPRSTPLMSYGKKKMRPEYWFSVPRNRVDDLYHFLQLWVPQRYGELSDDEIRQRGFEPVDSDTELWDEQTGEGMSGRASRSHSQDTDVAGELSRESWELIKAPYVKIYSILKTQTGSSDTDPTILGDEVLSRSEELRRALHGISTDSLGEVELTPPDLVGATEILTYEHREQLCRHLPARAEGYVWTLVFSTSQHGFSLNSMYRKMQKIESPILMVIEDTDNNVFGALTSCALKVSDHFYGTGESLLFRFAPHFQVYNWTGENMYFVKGNNESLSIGAGDGKFGIWLDGDLYQGRTETCNTYGNDPLTANEDFVVKTLECWAFI